MAIGRTREQTVAINDRVRGLSYEHSDEPIAFFCECGDALCLRPVWLTAAEFDRERALERGVVARHAARSHAAA